MLFFIQQFIVDRMQFANTVLWLEDQKIRHYKIEDRAPLRAIGTTNWENEWEAAFRKYKGDVGMMKVNGAAEELSWLLSYAVRLEYFDNGKYFRLFFFAGTQKLIRCTFQLKRIKPLHLIG